MKEVMYELRSLKPMSKIYQLQDHVIVTRHRTTYLIADHVVTLAQRRNVKSGHRVEYSGKKYRVFNLSHFESLSRSTRERL